MNDLVDIKKLKFLWKLIKLQTIPANYFPKYETDFTLKIAQNVILFIDTPCISGPYQDINVVKSNTHITQNIRIYFMYHFVYCLQPWSIFSTQMTNQNDFKKWGVHSWIFLVNLIFCQICFSFFCRMYLLVVVIVFVPSFVCFHKLYYYE